MAKKPIPSGPRNPAQSKIAPSNKMSSRPLAAATPKTAPDRALEPGRSVGSGPSMSKTMPAPRNYGGITAQPMPAFPGDSKGGIKTLPIRPTDPKPKIVPLSPKDPSIQNMPTSQEKVAVVLKF